eukprot:CAMPEP_0168313862 /NCGR_PEP_ID=MMETSP0210-20121227/4935_1 /TAXON_ID=40633 /ORGANISM="Condylostoma magnum, Strain COL2" /LENGTH=51 /DNA_ID=CAMNT_0008275983 /DNA_START=913 /DNA_END=1068 /DNA_ORIENTATION=+
MQITLPKSVIIVMNLVSLAVGIKMMTVLSVLLDLLNCLMESVGWIVGKDNI